MAVDFFLAGTPVDQVYDLPCVLLVRYLDVDDEPNDDDDGNVQIFISVKAIGIFIQYCC